MTHHISDFRAQLLLRAASAAFFRDRLNKKRQFHWHFSGKCEALLFGTEASIYEIGEKLAIVSENEETYRQEDDWKKWNHAQGWVAGLSEVLGFVELALSKLAFDQRALATANSEFERELSAITGMARTLRAAFKVSSPLHGFFDGMANALNDARFRTADDIDFFFRSVRVAAQKGHHSAGMCQWHAGTAAGCAEAYVLKEFTGAAVSGKPPICHSAIK